MIRAAARQFLSHAVSGKERYCWKAHEISRGDIMTVPDDSVLIEKEEGDSMISLLLSFAVLIVGYCVYGRIVERVFGPDDRETPAVRINDGVDNVPMKTWKAFLVQLLNIAGTGPIFGALMGACFGPIVFLWIIFGSVLRDAVTECFV